MICPACRAAKHLDCPAIRTDSKTKCDCRHNSPGTLIQRRARVPQDWSFDQLFAAGFFERFWAKVIVGEINECWPWSGATVLRSRKREERGVIRLPIPDGRNVYVPRVAFLFANGWWPEPCALHGCDNPLCCNAFDEEHVHEGTRADNVREMWDRGRAIQQLIDWSLFRSSGVRQNLTDDKAT